MGLIYNVLIFTHMLLKKGTWYRLQLKVFGNSDIIRDHSREYYVLQQHLSRQVSDVLEHHTPCHPPHFEVSQAVYVEIFAGWDFSSKWPLGAYQPLSEGCCMAVQMQLSGGTCCLAQKHCCKLQQVALGAPTRARCAFLQTTIYFTVQIIVLRRNTERNPSCALCLQRLPPADLSHDHPCCHWSCFRIKHLPVNLGQGFLAITTGPAFWWDTCILLPR